VAPSPTPSTPSNDSCGPGAAASVVVVGGAVVAVVVVVGGGDVVVVRGAVVVVVVVDAVVFEPQPTITRSAAAAKAANQGRVARRTA